MANFRGVLRSGSQEVRTSKSRVRRLLGRRRPCEREDEDRAAVGAGLYPDPPAVTLDDALADREPEAGPLELGAGVQPSEQVEDMLARLWRDADAVVADGKLASVIVLDASTWTTGAMPFA